MTPTSVRDLPSRCSGALEGAIDELGRPDFIRQVYHLINAIAAVDHCSLFAVQRDSARCLGANSADASPVARRAADRYVSRHWALDPALRQMRAASDIPLYGLQRIVPAQIHDRTYHRECYVDANICDKVAVSVQAGGMKILLTAYRDTGSGMFSDDSLGALSRHTELLGRLARKHVELVPAPDGPAPASRTRAMVEDLLAQIDAGLTVQERAVLARLATGMSTEAVALDMAVMPSSVATYRKRAYARLRISGLPELFALLLAKRGGALA